MNRVVVTGLGCVTPFGAGTVAFWDALIHGRDRFSELAMEERQGLNFSLIGRVTDFDPSTSLSPEQLLVSDRSSQFALVAAREALDQSGLLESSDRHDIGVIFGCSAGGRATEEAALAKLYTVNARVHPLTVPRSMMNAGTSLVSMAHRLTGPSYTVSTACASATHAIGQAFHMVRSGSLRAVVTGGHDAPLTHGFLHAWNSLRVVSPTRCKPFAKDRDGITLSEGAAVLVLESLESALRRSASILGEIIGFGMSSDAHHMTQPKCDGPVSAMRHALRDAREEIGSVRYINAHGTGTLANDAVEAGAIREVFENLAENIPLSSTKSMHGHAMGASGAIEAVATVLAIKNGVLPPTAHTTEIEPGLGIDVIVGEARPGKAGIALSNSFAFGGLNAVLAFKTV